VIGGRPVRMRFAGRALEPVMLPALAHLERAAGDATDLDIRLWDSASTGVPGPDLPWEAEDVRARGDIHGHEGIRVRMLCDAVSGAITALDREDGTLVYWVSDARVVPWYESGAPLRAALHAWAAGPGRHFVHAGAVGSGGAGVLLAGLSGAGKSSAALACLEAGLEYAGDDYVLLTTDGPPRAHSLYSTAKLDPDALARLPGLAPAVSDFRRGEEEKAVLQLHRHRPDQLRASLPVSAIVLPSIGDAERPTLRRASAAEALRALAPSTILQLPGAGRQAMDAMAGLVRRVPAYALELGTDLDPVPGLIAEVCRTHGAQLH
jgi:hypothetical protein